MQSSWQTAFEAVASHHKYMHKSQGLFCVLIIFVMSYMTSTEGCRSSEQHLYIYDLGDRYTAPKQISAAINASDIDVVLQDNPKLFNLFD